MMNQEKIEQSSLKEQLNTLFEILEDMPPLHLGRNDPCICGSGLKYKKCCLIKNKNPATVSLESFEIKTDALTPEEAKNDFPAVSLEDEKLISKLYHNLREHKSTITSEDCEYFQQLNALHVKYPDNPLILNYITGGYELLGKHDRLEELVAKTYEKFPNYLFAQTAQANIYLRDGFPEKAFEILKGAHTLKQLFPHRTVFHITEVRAFEYFMVCYFCKLGNFEPANSHFKILQEILEEDDWLLQSAEKKLKQLKALYSFRALLKTRKKDKKRGRKK